MRSDFRFFPQVLLEVKDGIPHLIVFAYVVGTEHVHSLGVLPEGTRVVVGRRGLATAAETPTEGTRESEKQVLPDGQHGYANVNGQVQLHLQLVNAEAVGRRQGTSKQHNIGGYLGVGNEHPLAE